jgi:hypothetical protein
MQKEMPVGHVRIAHQVIDPIGIEQRRAPLDTVHIVAFGEQQIGKIRAVLACYAGYQSDLTIHCVPLVETFDYSAARAAAHRARVEIV